jgi:flagellar basal body-associated protein FliL
MTTGPHEPVGGGRYHEQPGRANPVAPGGRGGGGGGSRKPDPEPPATGEIAELRRHVAALTAAMDVLRSAVTESDIRPSDTSEDPSRPKRGRRATPSSDPALTRVTRRFRIATAAISLMVALIGAMGASLASAWSYIKGYGDERAASAVEAEHAKAQLEAQAQRIEDLLKNQQSMQTASTDLQTELERARRTRNLLELRAKYLEEVRSALVQKRRIPDKSAELLQAERDAERSP